VDEIVALYDERGRPAGSAPRSQMRARNLRHAATAVVVRDPLGRVYLHRRTDSKDVYPGRWDFAAGGVVLDGEDPAEAAVREAEEELGVTSPLVALGEGDYADDHTTYHAFRFVTEWDGPVRWQPEEVADGRWVTLEELDRLIKDPATELMPDTVALFGDWLAERLADVRRPEQGWDSETTIVEERWVDRLPRRPDVAPALRAEAAVLGQIADLLPLSVPRPEVVDEDPLRLRHAIVPGEPADPERLTAEDGAAVGAFLRALHDIPSEVWSQAALSPIDTRATHLRAVARMERMVIPRLPEELRNSGRELLTVASARPRICLVHGDLGPSHLLSTEGRVTGIIDWTDVHVGDPALDLAWILHGTPPPFAEAVADVYGVSTLLGARALTWRRLGPWHEVLYGLDGGGPSYVESGLAGVIARL
jgi:aminoglycoside phosphotransferase (APT) family kinase protein